MGSADDSLPHSNSEPTLNGRHGDQEPRRVKLEALTPGTRVSGVVVNQPVTVVDVVWHGSNAITLTYRDPSGQTHQRLLYRDHESILSLEEASRPYAFDGDPALFRLAAEALRIRMAAQFDPMLAVTTSDLEPLPHQIKAVYGELLPRTPLRFLLADDPGAGKTIMAGLYIKELMLRGDLARCLIVAPGSLVEQWQEELLDRFELRFELLTRSMVEASLDESVFDKVPLLIARMDQLSRAEDLKQQLERSDWDLVVVDEAHRMSAHYFGTELKTTKRYELGRLLGRVTRHFLLMTATPHTGKQEDFQLFMALLDADRFEGRYRDGVHSVDTDGLMRRMVKEELVTFEGKPLFPERIAETLRYQLSPFERELYEAVTQYVREEMNRADQLKAEGEGRRGNTVGFALTVLQRRLASSPEAILRSLERRRRRLEQRRQQLYAERGAGETNLERRLALLLGRVSDGTEVVPDEVTEDMLEDLTGDEREELEEKLVDTASAARTLAELDAEIKILAGLEELAQRVRWSGTDKKWTELRSLLLDNSSMYDTDGSRRKIIIFTEHRDTLNYLVDQIQDLLGRDDAVIAIHGGVRREARRAAQERFTNDKDAVVLVATDAAGEGLNLQRAHLMVNYDLPWNPNRIDQRFGRIHRIGQREVCRLWNLVADDTREGAVFLRLLAKVEEQRRAYQGKVFDVLGRAFEGRSLREVLIEAIRYGDQPEVRERLNQVIDAEPRRAMEKLISERALHHDVLAEADVQELRLRMEEARIRRLQPHYVQAFFSEVFRLLGGVMSAREAGRYEISHVPGEVRDRDRQIGTGPPVLRSYARVCFDRKYIQPPGKSKAALIAPGHPLLDSVVDVVIERYGTLLKQGALLIDGTDPGEEPRLLVAMTHEIVDGRTPAKTISKRFEFVEIRRDGQAESAGPAPYLDYRAPTADEEPHLKRLLTESWLTSGVEELAINWAITHGVNDHLREAEERVKTMVARTRVHVRQRLTQEINYWDTRYAELLDQQAAGKTLKIKPETAHRRARDLERRLEKRLAELDLDEALRPLPPVVVGGALVVPQGLLDRLLGRRSGPVVTYAKDTAEVNRRAVAAVMAAERRLGRMPTEMPHNNKGYDIRSLTPDGHYVFIEVKGRMAGAEDFVVTRNEVLYGQNAERYRLALVSVHPEGPEFDEVRYVLDPFRGFEFGSFAADAVRGNWQEMWSKGVAPL
ncbi:helicase-related protein [Thermasporomyces composti]|uniref:SNF2 domain-containing protein n=1 Tax=Thermasporomyces composti TaxID=696763 RepID=A0A3D9V4W4_THECX|nr:helicase-related protein [Thermasporomyces composti]REF36406.1 SNF2 domain-containing protein [Thermasporomyces composti]